MTIMPWSFKTCGGCCSGLFNPAGSVKEQLLLPRQSLGGGDCSEFVATSLQAPSQANMQPKSKPSQCLNACHTAVDDYTSSTQGRSSSLTCTAQQHCQSHSFFGISQNTGRRIASQPIFNTIEVELKDGIVAGPGLGVGHYLGMEKPALVKARI